MLLRWGGPIPYLIPLLLQQAAVSVVRLGIEDLRRLDGRYRVLSDDLQF
jgi:hypothetical protein